MFLEIRDKIYRLVKEPGVAISMEEIITGICGSSWTLMACVDRLVELKELVEYEKNTSPVIAQYRLFGLRSI